jgi:hypothetical protein
VVGLAGIELFQGGRENVIHDDSDLAVFWFVCKQ